MILGLLGDGVTFEEIIQDYYAHIAKEDILACIRYGKSVLEEEGGYVL